MTRGIDTQSLSDAVDRLHAHIDAIHPGDKHLIGIANEIRMELARVGADIATLMMLHEAQIAQNRALKAELRN